MGDVLVTSDMQLVRLPDLAWIADQHPLAGMKNHKVEGGTIAVTGDPHSSKLYYDRYWSTGTKWRVYYTSFPTPATGRVALTDDPTGGEWTDQALTIPAFEAWEASSYGIGSTVLIRTPGMDVLGMTSEWKAYYQYRNSAGDYLTGVMDTEDGLTFTNKRRVYFDATLSDHAVQAITGAIWDEVNQKIIAVAHVGADNARLYGAVVESTDGINFTTTSLLLDPGLNRATVALGDLFDVHWIDKVGSVYVILWTTSLAGTVQTIQTGIGVSVDLDHWYVPPSLVWPYDPANTALRYPASTYVAGHYYVVGVNAGSDGIDVVDIPPS